MYMDTFLMSQAEVFYRLPKAYSHHICLPTGHTDSESSSLYSYAMCLAEKQQITNL